MNIFFVHSDPVLAARDLADQHQKMILESAQLLSQATRHLFPDYKGDLYKDTHTGHPSAVWSRESVNNFDWLVRHSSALTAEMHMRGGSIHSSYTRVIQHLPNQGTWKEASVGLCAMRPDFLVYPEPESWDQVVENYRNYYAKDKLRFATWKNRPPPEWLMERAFTQGLKLFFKNNRWWFEDESDLPPVASSMLQWNTKHWAKYRCYKSFYPYPKKPAIL